MKCSICSNDIQPQRNELGQVMWDQGNNAEPVNSGRCCDACNSTVVIPSRLQARGVFKNDG